MSLQDLQLPPEGETFWHEEPTGIVFARRELTDGKTAWVVPTLYGARLIVGDAGAPCYDRYWCFNHGLSLGPLTAIAALSVWDGTGEPQGWTKHGQDGQAGETAART